MKRVWLVRNKVNGFEFIVMVNATEADLVDYIKTELKGAYTYHGASDEEIKMADMLGLPTYMA